MTGHDRVARFIYVTASIAVILGGIYLARSVLILFIVSALLAVLGTPPVIWLQRRRVPVVVAVALVMAGIVMALLVVISIVGTALSGFSAALPGYQARIAEYMAEGRGMLAARGIVLPDGMPLKYIDPGAIMGLVGRMIAELGTVLSHMVLIVLTVTFMLLEASTFPGKFRAVYQDHERGLSRLEAFANDLKGFVMMKTMLSLATGVISGLWFYLLGVDFPVLWGFLAFLLNFVPAVGSTMAGIPPILLSFIQFGPGQTLLVLVGYMATNFVLDNLIAPGLMGRRVGLSTLVVFISMVVWGSLLGPVGVLLCIPLTMTVRFACESDEGTQWIAILLGPRSSPNDTNDG